MLIFALALFALSFANECDDSSCVLNASDGMGGQRCTTPEQCVSSETCTFTAQFDDVPEGSTCQSVRQCVVRHIHIAFVLIVAHFCARKWLFVRVVSQFFTRCQRRICFFFLADLLHDRKAAQTSDFAFA